MELSHPPIHSWRVWACLLSLAVLALVLAGPIVAEEEPQPAVAFVNYGNIHWSGFHEVTDDRRRDEQPALSPDGQTVAYVRSFYSWMPTIRLESEIVRIKVDGTGLLRLTDNDLLESWPTWSPDGTKLAFAAGDLYVMPVSTAGGGAPVRLTTGELNPQNLAWSADGTRLAFNSWPCADEYECDAAELYVVSLAGPQVTRLTDNGWYDGDPTWSPDGTQLAFETAAADDIFLQIHLIAAGGGLPVPLVSNSRSTDPAWSPDGALIAYINAPGKINVVRPDGTNQHTLNDAWGASDPTWTSDSHRLIYYELHEQCGLGGCMIEEFLYRWNLDSGQKEALIETNVLNAFDPGPYLSWTATDGRVAFSTNYFLRTADISGALPAAVKQLTADAPVNGDPAWSPDGHWIVFSSQRPFDYNIHVIAPDGSSRRELTTHPANDWNPTWSSAGQIAFTSNRDGNWELYVMNADGSGQTNLSHTPTIAENDAAWSPNGAQLAYARQEGGNWDIYLMNANGTGLRRLTTHAAADRNPTWSPDGTRIAFETNRDGNGELYLLTVAGPPGNEVNWTNDPDTQREPTWSPGGTQIAFGHIYIIGGFDTASVSARRLSDHVPTMNIQNVSLNPQPAFRPFTTELTPRILIPIVRR